MPRNLLTKVRVAGDAYATLEIIGPSKERKGFAFGRIVSVTNRKTEPISTRSLIFYVGQQIEEEERTVALIEGIKNDYQRLNKAAHPGSETPPGVRRQIARYECKICEKVTDIETFKEVLADLVKRPTALLWDSENGAQ